MAWALQFDAATQYTAFSTNVTAPTSNFTLEARFEYGIGVFAVITTTASSSTSQGAFRIEPRSSGVDVLYTLSGKSRVIQKINSWTGYKTLRIEWDSTSQEINIYLDDVLQTTSTGYATFNIDDIRRIGVDQGGNTGPYFNLEFLSITQDSLIYRWDATASDHSNTGQQPVLVDTVGGNDATGANFPTDGSAWIDLGGGGGVDGTIAITMLPFTSAGSGNIGEAVTGTVSELLDDLVINGIGVVGDNPTGTVNIAMGDISSNAAGNIGEAVTGAALITMSDINVTSTGNVGEAVTGSVAAQAEDLVIYGEGTFALAVTGTANIQMEDFVIYGRESQEGGIYGAISAMPIEAEEINAIPIEVITK